MEYKIIEVHGRQHVCRFSNRVETVYKRKDEATGEVTERVIPAPNYLGTGMVLSGVVRIGETIEQFLKRKR